MNHIKAIPIEEVTIEFTDLNDSKDSFTLEAPNADEEGIFVYGYEPLEIYSDYRDDNLILQDGERYFRFFAEYQYESHEMDFRELLGAKSITLKTPPVFGDVNEYQTHEVFLDNDSARRGYFRGLAMGGGDFTIPNSAESIRFVGRSALTWDEMLADEQWDQPLKPKLATNKWLHVDADQEDFGVGTLVAPNDYSQIGNDFGVVVNGLYYRENSGHNYFESDYQNKVANAQYQNPTSVDAHIFVVCRIFEEPNATALVQPFHRIHSNNRYNGIGVTGTSFVSSKADPLWAVWYEEGNIFETGRTLDTNEILFIELKINGSDSYIKFNDNDTYPFSGQFMDRDSQVHIGREESWAKISHLYELVWYDRILTGDELTDTIETLQNKYSDIL